MLLTCYIIKYIVRINEESYGYGESFSDGGSPSPTCFKLCGDGDNFGDEDGDGKAILIPALPHPAPLSSLLSKLLSLPLIYK